VRERCRCATGAATCWSTPPASSSPRRSSKLRRTAAQGTGYQPDGAAAADAGAAPVAAGQCWPGHTIASLAGCCRWRKAPSTTQASSACAGDCRAGSAHAGHRRADQHDQPGLRGYADAAPRGADRRLTDEFRRHATDGGARRLRHRAPAVASPSGDRSPGRRRLARAPAMLVPNLFLCLLPLLSAMGRRGGSVISIANGLLALPPGPSVRRHLNLQRLHGRPCCRSYWHSDRRSRRRRCRPSR